jgi:hypothetical protein
MMVLNSTMFCFVCPIILFNVGILLIFLLLLLLNTTAKQAGLSRATLKISSEFSSKLPLRTHKSHSTVSSFQGFVDFIFGNLSSSSFEVLEHFALVVQV